MTTIATEPSTGRLMELETKIDALTETVEFLADEAIAARRQRDAVVELVADLQPVMGQFVERTIAQAATLEEKGYFEFAEAAIGVADSIVAGYSREDVEALGDNIVHILDVVKDLTQPEVLALAERLLDVVRHQAMAQQTTVDDPPPSLFALARKVGDPEVRRGMGRALDTLKAVSTTDATMTIPPKHSNEPPHGGA